MKYGIHAGLWQAKWTDEITPILKTVADLGFDGVEVSLLGMTDEKAAALNAALRDHNLEVTCSDGLAPDKDITSPDANIREAGVAYLKWAIKTTSLIGSHGLAGVVFQHRTRGAGYRQCLGLGPGRHSSRYIPPQHGGERHPQSHRQCGGQARAFSRLRQ